MKYPSGCKNLLQHKTLTSPFTIDSKAERTAAYYDKLSGRYDHLYPAYLKHTHAQFLNRIQLSGQDSILDISAGTGILAEEIIRRYGSFQKLVLNDPSPQMLSRAKERVKHYSNVEFTGYFAENPALPASSFSQIICLNSFHYYVDQPLVLKHFKRLLKPGGTLWIQDWNRAGRFRIVNKMIDWFSPEHINTRTVNEMKKLLEEAGFQSQEDVSWGYRWWNFFFIKSV